MKKSTRLRAAGALAALGALAIVGAGGAASADAPSKATAKITMKKQGRNLFFEGPKTVAVGDTLKIKNLTDPRRVGPHTFSLVREEDIPTTNKEIKKCGQQFAKICGEVVEWHRVNLESGNVRKNPVDVGQDGWDREGSLQRKGDSWVSEKEDESFSREVTAAAGKDLHFFCAVHPEMQGAVTVQAAK